MFKKMIMFTIICSLASLYVGAKESGDFNGNKRKGKYLLRKIYKQCKKRGEVKSATPKISPADKTQAQWQALYTLMKKNKDQKNIKKKMQEFGCWKEWKAVKKKPLLDIFTYMYKHASDSSTPARCK